MLAPAGALAPEGPELGLVGTFNLGTGGPELLAALDAGCLAMGLLGGEGPALRGSPRPGAALALALAWSGAGGVASPSARLGCLESSEAIRPPSLRRLRCRLQRKTPRTTSPATAPTTPIMRKTISTGEGPPAPGGGRPVLCAAKLVTEISPVEIASTPSTRLTLLASFGPSVLEERSPLVTASAMSGCSSTMVACTLTDPADSASWMASGRTPWPASEAIAPRIWASKSVRSVGRAISPA
mmetsp:Transcript_11926/g.32741  ORF Transcript_11926/g.32741 Transcript_11926/m.32741 type:complete len:241 (+) Transcript_11926:543-1265(+)